VFWGNQTGCACVWLQTQTQPLKQTTSSSVVTNSNINLFFKKKKHNMKGYVMRGAIKNIRKILILDNITTYEFAEVIPFFFFN
jgi:hypothetical protein